MTKLDDPNHPLWPTFDNPQETLWIVFYKGLSGKWIATSPCYFQENAERLASKLDRPTRILEYKLEDDIEVDQEELRRKYINIRTPKVRQPIRVRMPKGE